MKHLAIFKCFDGTDFKFDTHLYSSRTTFNLVVLVLMTV